VTRGEREGWVIIAGLFATLFFVFGSGYNTAGVFVAPLVAHFGWSHAQVSLLQTRWRSRPASSSPSSDGSSTGSRRGS
jgi:fucose permease